MSGFVTSHKWQKVRPTIQIDPRCGASMHFLGEDPLLAPSSLFISFGQSDLTTNRTFLSSSFLYDVSSKQWSSVPNTIEMSEEYASTGLNRTQLMGRAEHGSCVLGDEGSDVLIFGGRMSMLSSDCTNETLLFSASKQTWLPVYSQEAPTARRGCSLVARGDDRSKSFLFGGQAGTVCMNDLWQFSSGAMTWMRMRHHGQVPVARSFHASYSIGPLLTVFAGKQSNRQHCDSQFHVYDARAGSWVAFNHRAMSLQNHVRVAGTHTAHFIPSHSKCLMFGDRNSTDMVQFDVHPLSGAPRPGSSVVVLPSSVAQDADTPEPRLGISCAITLAPHVFTDAGAGKVAAAHHSRASLDQSNIVKLCIFGGAKTAQSCSSGMRVANINTCLPTQEEQQWQQQITSARVSAADRDAEQIDEEDQKYCVNYACCEIAHSGVLNPVPAAVAVAAPVNIKPVHLSRMRMKVPFNTRDDFLQPVRPNNQPMLVRADSDAMSAIDHELRTPSLLDSSSSSSSQMLSLSLPPMAPSLSSAMSSFGPGAHDADSGDIVDQVIRALWSSPSQTELDRERDALQYGTSSRFAFERDQVLEIIHRAHSLLSVEPNIVQVTGEAKLFGDLHGMSQIFDMRRLLQGFGAPDAIDSNRGMTDPTNFVFIGDFVDRGAHSIEVMVLLLAFKIKYPNKVFLLRGNHEDRSINMDYGFYTDCLHRFDSPMSGTTVFDAFMLLFNHLPLAARVNHRILCVHGGIGRVQTLAQIEAIPRGLPIFDPQTNAIMNMDLLDLMWSDPNDDIHGVIPSRRFGTNDLSVTSVEFGPDVARDFCKRNHIDVIVRGHEVAEDGFKCLAGGRVITVFSATNYCGSSNNDGAMLHVVDAGDRWRILPKYIDMKLQMPIAPPSPRSSHASFAASTAPSLPAVSNSSSFSSSSSSIIPPGMDEDDIVSPILFSSYHRFSSDGNWHHDVNRPPTPTQKRPHSKKK